MRIVALVPIKLKSQRLPNKNLLPFAGHPLCWHICNTLLKVDLIDDVYVYCSDESINDYIPEDVHFLKRDKCFDGDTVKAFQFYEAFIRDIDADIYVVAHTTAPFITDATITDALEKVVLDSYDSAFASRRIQTFAWYDGKPINYDLNDVPRTQDMKPIYVETSGFFIFKKDVFAKYKRRIGFHPYIKEVSEIEAIDIDEKEDYDFACLISKGIAGVL